MTDDENDYPFGEIPPIETIAELAATWIVKGIIGILDKALGIDLGETWPFT